MRLLPLLLLVLLTAAIRADEADGIKKLEGRGAVVRRDEKAPGKPAVGATLTGDAGTDASLKDLRELGQLRELHLYRSKVTDAGLKELKDLKQLRTLDLSHTAVTGVGLKELRGLAELRKVWLFNSK